MRVLERDALARAPASGRRGLKSVAALAAILIGAFAVRWVVSTATGSLFRPELAEGFFRTYVTGDGRVVRPENGSDTVSEGQAYAMLLAVALDDPSRFDRVWGWTAANLRRPDGLLSWRWKGGAVADPEPAADADVDAAVALRLAASRFGRPSYAREATRLERAILARETFPAGGTVVLAAGPWARERRLVNPSYLWPEAFARFEDGTDVRRSSIAVAEDLTARGSRLPPDWAHVGADGTAVPAPDPSRSGREAEYFLDAPRMVVRFAASCDPRAKDVAARLWPRLERARSTHPVQTVAAAAAAHAAGDTGARDELLVRAERATSHAPNYYASAWVALGRAMLDDGVLLGCS